MREFAGRRARVGYCAEGMGVITVDRPLCRMISAANSAQEQTPSPSLEARGTGMFRIPEELALYLTGQGGQMNEMFSLEEVPEAEEIKQLSRRMPVVKRVAERHVHYTYHSSDAAWLRVAAPFNWLLVDVPVTVAENAAMLAGVAGVIWLLAEVDDDDCDDCHHHGHRHHH